MSTYVSVVISPATTTRPVVISVSHATRPSGSSRSTASSTESEIWSAILSGCPSVTDSEVKRNVRAAMWAARLPSGRNDLLVQRQERLDAGLVVAALGGDDERAQRLEVRPHVVRDLLLAELGNALDQTNGLVEVDEEKDVAPAGELACVAEGVVVGESVLV